VGSIQKIGVSAVAVNLDNIRTFRKISIPSSVALRFRFPRVVTRSLVSTGPEAGAVSGRDDLLNS